MTGGGLDSASIVPRLVVVDCSVYVVCTLQEEQNSMLTYKEAIAQLEALLDTSEDYDEEGWESSEEEMYRTQLESEWDLVAAIYGVPVNKVIADTIDLVHKNIGPN